MSELIDNSIHQTENGILQVLISALTIQVLT
jgi:hypothetical protein